jgi:hypothetical protein
MLLDPKNEERLAKLAEQLCHARAVTPELIGMVIAGACVRFVARESAAKMAFNRLIRSGAWIDAILGLIELELPQWKLRRLVCEDGEWLCSLSRHPQLPIGLDEVAEASHETMPLAILIAFVEARRLAAASAAGSTAVPQVRPAPTYAMCCDNFA